MFFTSSIHFKWKNNLFVFLYKNINQEFLSRKNDFKRPFQKINFHQVEHFLEKLSSSSNIRVLEFTPYYIEMSTLNPDVQGFLFKDSPILGSKIRLGTKIHIAMRGSNFL